VHRSDEAARISQSQAGSGGNFPFLPKAKGRAWQKTMKKALKKFAG
jgi:hypothetical protein